MTYHAADKLENHHRFSSWIPFHPLLCEGQAELYRVKVQLLEINSSGVSSVNKLFDLFRFVAIWLCEFTPHAGREIRQPVRVIGARVILRAIKYRFDEMGDAFSSSVTAKASVSAIQEFRFAFYFWNIRTGDPRKCQPRASVLLRIGK